MDAEKMTTVRRSSPGPSSQAHRQRKIDGESSGASEWGEEKQQAGSATSDMPYIR